MFFHSTKINHMSDKLIIPRHFAIATVSHVRDDVTYLEKWRKIIAVSTPRLRKHFHLIWIHNHAIYAFQHFSLLCNNFRHAVWKCDSLGRAF